MCRRLAAESAYLQVDDRELRRGGISYTLHTLQELATELGANRPLYFLIGADSLRDLHQWYHLKELLQCATFVTVARADAEIDACWPALVERVGEAATQVVRNHVLQAPPRTVSSTDLRQRLATGESVEGQLPATVIDWIQQRKLYRNAD